MKRRISLLMVLVLILTMMIGTTASASTRLTTREKAIAKAYIKTIDEQDAKYINRYKHRSVDKFVVADLNGKSVKFFDTKFKKKYDKNEKMNYLEVSGILIVYDDDENLIISEVTTGIYIKKSGSKVFAYGENNSALESEIISPDDLDDDVYSDIEEFLLDEFDEDTVESMFEIAAEYADGQGDYDDSESEDDNYFNTPDTKQEPQQNNSTVNTGSSKVEWSGTQDLANGSITGDFSVELNSYKTYTAEEIKSKFGISTSCAYYVAADVTYTVNGYYATNSSGATDFYSLAVPKLEFSIPTSQINENVTDKNFYTVVNYFNTSIGSAMDKKFKFKTMKDTDKVNFAVSGTVLCGVDKPNVDNSLAFNVEKDVFSYLALK